MNKVRIKTPLTFSTPRAVIRVKPPCKGCFRPIVIIDQFTFCDCYSGFLYWDQKLPGGKKQRAMLKLLLLRRPIGASKEEMLDFIYPDEALDRPEIALSHLRNKLAVAGFRVERAGMIWDKWKNSYRYQLLEGEAK